MSTENKTIAELALEIKTAHQTAIDKVKEVAEEALGKASKGEQLSTSMKLLTDEALIKMNGLTEQVAAIEQKMARTGSDTPEHQKSFGEQMTEAETFKAFGESGFAKSSRGADIRIKATLTSATTNAAGSLGAGIPTTTLPGVLGLPQRKMTVRDLISTGQMDGNSLEYIKEKGFNNNAGMVAEGAAKPSSDLQLESVTTSAKVIAHWMKASKQVLSDISQLRSLIDQRLLYGLSFVEEQQLLNGDGTGQNLHGIIPQATAYSAPFAVADSTAIDTIRLAALQASLAEYPATGIVMHPTDWARVELTKDAGGNYIIGNPQGSLSPTLWGLPVVTTQAIAVDKTLVGAFQLGAQLFDRWDARIEVGFVDDDFIKNLVTILAEERLALAVYRPEAFIYADLGYVA